jgi:hypothetical protein
MNEIVDFVCPKCTSRYKLVRVRLEQEVPSRLIFCRFCKEPLASTDGEYALKYFLIEKSNKHNGFDLQMKHHSLQGESAGGS